MEHIAHFFLDIVEKFGYPGLFGVMVVGNVGIPIGAEFVVLAAGALAATGHLPSVWGAGLTATLGEMAGNSIMYFIGFKGGRPFVVRYGKYVKLDEKKLDTFHGFLERKGSIVIFVCRFLPLIRGVAGLPAGVARMPYPLFLAWTAAGSAIFCFGLAYLGGVFGRHFEQVLPYIRQGSLGIAVVAVLAIVGYVLVRRSRRAAA